MTGDDLPATAIEFARRNNVTQIVVGKSRERLWKLIFGRSLAHALLKQSGGAAVHFVTDGAPEPGGGAPSLKETARPRSWLAYPAAAGLVGVAMGVAALLDRSAAGADLAMIFLAAVLISGLVLGLRPALFAAIVAVFSYNFFFLEPRFSMTIGHPGDVLTFIIFIAVASATGWLAGRGARPGQFGSATGDRHHGVARLKQKALCRCEPPRRRQSPSGADFGDGGFGRGGLTA